MTTQPTTAWGQTLKTASFMRQEKRGSLSEPIPGFFQDKPTPEGGGQVHILRAHEAHDTVTALNQLKQRALSPEFMRAITLTEPEDSFQSQSYPEKTYAQDRPPQGAWGRGAPQESEQGVVFKMNKFSLVALIMGLLLLGLMFFAGGLMLAFNFTSQEASAPHQAQQSHWTSGALTAGQGLVTFLPAGVQPKVNQATQVVGIAQAVAAPVPNPSVPAPGAPAAQVVPPVQGAGATPPLGMPAAPAPLGAMPGARGAAAAPSGQAPVSLPLPGASAPVSQPVYGGAVPPPIGAPLPSPAPVPGPALQVVAPQPDPGPAPVGRNGVGAPAPQQAPGVRNSGPVSGAPPVLGAPPPQAAGVQVPQGGKPVATGVKIPPLDATALTRPFSLQVGAYKSLEGAQKVVTLLQRRGYNAYVVALSAGVLGKDFAVRMGGYYTRQAAMTAAEHLMHKEHFKMMSITKNNAERVILEGAEYGTANCHDGVLLRAFASLARLPACLVRPALCGGYKPALCHGSFGFKN